MRRPNGRSLNSRSRPSKRCAAPIRSSTRSIAGAWTMAPRRLRLRHLSPGRRDCRYPGEAGYHTYDALLVSSSAGKTKMTGSSSPRRNRASRSTRRRWLHIGDDLYSDIRMARKAGIATWHYASLHRPVQPHRDAARWDRHEPPFGQAHRPRACRQPADECQIHGAPSRAGTFWHDFGYAQLVPFRRLYGMAHRAGGGAEPRGALLPCARGPRHAARLPGDGRPSGLETHYLLPRGGRWASRRSTKSKGRHCFFWRPADPASTWGSTSADRPGLATPCGRDACGRVQWSRHK